MAGCCGTELRFDGVSDDYRRRLWLVIAINATMFVVEMTAGRVAASQALMADAMDFFADALTYGLSLAVIGRPIAVRSAAAMVKAVSLLVIGLAVFGSTLWRFFGTEVPQAEIMGGIGFAALAANLTSVLLLYSYRNGDANVRSVWLCSRNDALSNIAVMVAALGVWGTMSRWPDLIVATAMAVIFLSSAWQIMRQALDERRESDAPADSCGASAGCGSKARDFVLPG